jgi:uncharacterized protein YigE (DUF2233 family)|tara:strand:+ start:276 stop:521 length:246 start_codon:yes stop_codon:yes gene_type:complete
MRDRTKEAVEAIDQTRMTMASIEGNLSWVKHLADRNKEGDMDEVKRLAKEQKDRLMKLRMGLNKAMFDNSFSPFGFDLKDE